jgi:hypothetical protein
MKRGPKPASSTSADQTGHRPELVKKTFLFEKNISMHLAVAAVVTGMEQAEIVRQATEARLKDMGCDLTRPPALPNIRPVDDMASQSRHRNR